MIKSNWPIKNLIISLGLILSKFIQKSFNLILNLHCLSSFGYNRVQLGLQFVQNCSLIFQYVWNPSLTSFSHVASLLSIIILFWKEKGEFREEFINRLWQWWWEGRSGGGGMERKKEKCMVFNSKQFAYNIYDSVKKKEREKERREKKNAWSLIRNNSHITSVIWLSMLVSQIFFSIMLLY